MSDVIVYSIAVFLSLGMLLTAYIGIAAVIHSHSTKIQRKIGWLTLCRLPFEALTILLLLWLYWNEFETLWMMGIPTGVSTVMMLAYIVAKASIVHGGFKKGVIYETNSFFTDLSNDLNRWFGSNNRGSGTTADSARQPEGDRDADDRDD